VARVTRAVASGLYNNTFGYLFGGATTPAEQSEVPADQEYICVDYLERQCDLFTRWATKHELTLMSLAKAKLSL